MILLSVKKTATKMLKKLHLILTQVINADFLAFT